jgi:hypothetical protein
VAELRSFQPIAHSLLGLFLFDSAFAVSVASRIYCWLAFFLLMPSILSLVPLESAVLNLLLLQNNSIKTAIPKRFLGF